MVQGGELPAELPLPDEAGEPAELPAPLETGEPGPEPGGWRRLVPRKRQSWLPRQLHVQEIRSRLAEVKAKSQATQSSLDAKSQARNPKIMASYNFV